MDLVVAMTVVYGLLFCCSAVVAIALAALVAAAVAETTALGCGS